MGVYMDTTLFSKDDYIIMGVIKGLITSNIHDIYEILSDASEKNIDRLVARAVRRGLVKYFKIKDVYVVDLPVNIVATCESAAEPFFLEALK